MNRLSNPGAMPVASNVKQPNKAEKASAGAGPNPRPPHARNKASGFPRTVSVKIPETDFGTHSKRSFEASNASSKTSNARTKTIHEEAHTTLSSLNSDMHESSSVVPRTSFQPGTNFSESHKNGHSSSSNGKKWTTGSDHNPQNMSSSNLFPQGRSNNGKRGNEDEASPNKKLLKEQPTIISERKPAVSGDGDHPRYSPHITKVILNLDSDCKYMGDVVDGKLTGKGAYTWADGSKYVGGVVDGRLTGKGTYTWPDGIKYVGEFVDGRITGKGILTLSNREQYEGYFVEGEPTGKIIHKCSNGDKYERDVDDEDGSVTYTSINGQTYVGEVILTSNWDNGHTFVGVGNVVDNKLTGQGTYTWPNGNQYKGEFVVGKRTGKGIYRWSNGNQYEGEFVNGRRTGKGIYTWSNGNKYEGEFVNGRRTGKGIYTWSNGNKYEGEFFDGKRTGQGTFTWRFGGKYEGAFVDGRQCGKGILFLSNGDIYEGEFSNDKRSGTGTLAYDNGDIYVGDFSDDKRNGKGKLTCPNGVIYEGGFSDDKRNGKGKLTCPNGVIYEGDFVDDKCSGTGKITYTNGVIYEGDVVNDKRHGKGKLTYDNRVIYEGDFVNDKRNGKGKLTYANGDIYEGDFVDDKRSGKGKLTSANGEIYEGDFVDDKCSGTGTYTWPNREKYEGDFVDGKRTGKGTYTWPNGNIYEGDFVDGKRTGKGTYTWPNREKYEGDFVDGKRTGKGTYTWPNGNIYEGDFVDGHLTGKGTFTFANYGKLEGEFVDSYLTGKGIFTWLNGDKYEGDFVGHRRTGKGTLTRVNGETYEGDFVDDKRTGKGTYTWPNGIRYEGDFDNGIRTGRGIFSWPNGYKYEGEFRYNKRTGRGFYTWPKINLSSLGICTSLLNPALDEKINTLLLALSDGSKTPEKKHFEILEKTEKVHYWNPDLAKMILDLNETSLNKLFWLMNSPFNDMFNPESPDTAHLFDYDLEHYPDPLKNYAPKDNAMEPCSIRSDTDQTTILDFMRQIITLVSELDSETQLKPRVNAAARIWEQFLSACDAKNFYEQKANFYLAALNLDNISKIKLRFDHIGELVHFYHFLKVYDGDLAHRNLVFLKEIIKWNDDVVDAVVLREGNFLLNGTTWSNDTEIKELLNTIGSLSKDQIYALDKKVTKFLRNDSSIVVIEGIEFQRDLSLKTSDLLKIVKACVRMDPDMITTIFGLLAAYSGYLPHTATFVATALQYDSLDQLLQFIKFVKRHGWNDAYGPAMMTIKENFNDPQSRFFGVPKDLLNFYLTPYVYGGRKK